MRIHSAAAAFIDEVKDRAVASTFLEPARLYCEVTGHSAAPDLDVHGVSTFLAALEAAGGIRTARVPAWEDVAKGAMDFAGAGAMEPDVLDALAADAALGRSYLAALGSAVCTPAQFAAWRRAWRPAPAHRFIWPGEAVSTRAFAARVVDATPANAPARAALAVYLGRFASVFDADRLLPRLFTALTAGDATMDVTEDLAAVLRHLRDADCDGGGSAGDGGSAAAGGSGKGEADVGDVRAVLWGMDGDEAQAAEPRFQKELARRIFDLAGVTVPAGGGFCA